MKPAELFEEIVRVAPSFATVRRAHIEDYGELLAHVLMGDLLRFVQSHFSGELREGPAAPTQVEMQAIFDAIPEIYPHTPAWRAAAIRLRPPSYRARLVGS